MISWIIVLGGLVISWHYTDLDSSSLINSMLCPVMVGIFAIVALAKTVASSGPSQRSGSRGSDGGGGFWGGGGDGGCGGGDGGGC